PAIDSLFPRLGDGMAALTVLIGLQLLQLTTRSLVLVNVVLVACWLAAAIAIVREFRRLTQAGAPAPLVLARDSSPGRCYSRAVAGFAERWRRRLGIEPGEERVLLAGMAALFLVEWAVVSVTNVAETFFLKRVGVARLPVVFLVNSILLTGTSVAVGRITARADQRLLLVRVLVV